MGEKFTGIHSVAFRCPFVMSSYLCCIRYACGDKTLSVSLC
jgi:hypothetical protein